MITYFTLSRITAKRLNNALFKFLCRKTIHPTPLDGFEAQKISRVEPDDDQYLHGRPMFKCLRVQQGVLSLQSAWILLTVHF